jgi:polyhydroxybutyrate depolymerase
MDRRLPTAALIAAALACGGGQQQSGPPTAAQLLKQRPYHLHVAPSYSATTAAPLLLGLHGYGSTAPLFESWWQLTPATDAHGMLYVALDGQVDRNGNQAWNAVPNSTLPPYDVAYVRAVIDDVSGKYNVDQKRIYVVGHSEGAFMAHRLACDVSDRIAAIVSYAGQAPLVDSLCHPAVPVSVVEVHGDHDSVILYDGSNGPSAHDTVGSWADRDGCTGKLAPTGQTLDIDADIAGAETKVEAYSGCPAGLAVELWTVQGSDHHPNLVEPQWAQTVTTWLLAHPKP